ncbi:MULTISPECIES: hypothetical protein [unclassified Frankia]
MRTIYRALAVSAASAVVLPATAQAAPQTGRPSAPATAPDASATATADGHLHLWRDTEAVDPFGNSWCTSYLSDSDDWGSCRNQISSLWNNGYPGSLDDVWLYWGTHQTHARRGVYNGVYLPDLAPYTFDAGTGRGAGQSIDNNVASHRWTNLP